jgi:hypothetical protein
VAQLVLAEAHSDLQLRLVAGLIVVVAALWWPLLLLARHGLRYAGATSLLLMAAGAASALYMLKQGTFFNVLAPLEPFLVVAAVAGAAILWRGGTRRARALVVACALAICLHAASVSGAMLTRAVPFPLGAAFVDVDNEAAVDRIAATVKTHTAGDEPVLVNPFFALVAQRHEAGNAVDWFILRALQRYCGSDSTRARHCTDWARVKTMVRLRRVAVVTVDTNVVSFDRGFERETKVRSMRRVIDVQAPPIKTTVYVR